MKPFYERDIARLGLFPNIPYAPATVLRNDQTFHRTSGFNQKLCFVNNENNSHIGTCMFLFFISLYEALYMSANELIGRMKVVFGELLFFVCL